jgi:hypothetical protein
MKMFKTNRIRKHRLRDRMEEEKLREMTNVGKENGVYKISQKKSH